MNNTTFLINGGAGRVINAIPALEKYERLNPNDDFKVIVHGWESLFWSHPTLQSRVFGQQKGNFENLIKNNKVVCPEPYQLYNFYNQHCNLVEAFDECINNTTDHSDLNYNCLYLSDFEKQMGRDIIGFNKETHKKKKTVVFQPYGSGTGKLNLQPVDRSGRSLSADHYLKIANKISNDTLIFYASPPEFRNPLDQITIPFDQHQPYLRTMMALISECDFYVGICSVGQHMARAFNKPGVVIMGATNEINFSYPDHFTILRKKDRAPSFSPWRVSDVDVEFADRLNDGIMNFTEDELNEIADIIKKGLGNKGAVNNLETLTFGSNYS